MHSDRDILSDARVGVVGAGRLGGALLRALGEAGVDVAGPLGRDEVPTGCDAIVLCVPAAVIRFAGRMLPANGAPEFSGSRTTLRAPFKSSDCEKSPFRSAAVGMVRWMTACGLLTCQFSIE